MRGELAIVRLLQARGLAAEKVSRTGYTGPDLTVPVLGRDLKCEVKYRHSFQRLYEWLDGNDLLVIRADRKPPLIVMSLQLAGEVAEAAEGLARKDVKSERAFASTKELSDA
jgi:hypothetical protein